MNRRRSRLKTGCMGVVCLTIIMVLLAFIAIQAALKARVAALKSSGQPMTAAQLLGPEPPDSQNAAVIYDRAFKAAHDPSLRSDLNIIRDYCSPEKRLSEPDLQIKAKESLSRMKTVVQLVEQAQSRPKCRFPVNWDAGATQLYKHLGGCRVLAKILQADCVASAKAGRMEKAVRSAILCYGLAEDCLEEPNIIAQLVGKAIISETSDGLLDALNCDMLNEQQARSLYDALSRIDVNRCYARSMQGERLIGTATYNKLRSNPKALKECLVTITGNLNSWVMQVPDSIVVPSYGKAICILDQMTYLGIMDKQVKTAHLTYREAARRNLLIKDSDIPSYAVMARALTVMSPKMRQAIDGGIAEVDEARIVAALYVYRNRFGRYPASLRDLKNKTIWKLDTTDPYSGSDFIYIPQGKGFLLYSIGKNMKDDGGKSINRSSSSGQDDIVWEVAGH